MGGEGRGEGKRGAEGEGEGTVDFARPIGVRETPSTGHGSTCNTMIGARVCPKHQGTLDYGRSIGGEGTCLSQPHLQRPGRSANRAYTPRYARLWAADLGRRISEETLWREEGGALGG